MEEIAKSLLGMGAAGPILALLLWLYWQERQERRELAAKVLEMSNASISAAKEMTTALNALASKVAHQ